MQRVEEFSTSYEEREEQTLNETNKETKCLLNMAYNNVEYLLGNIDMSESSIDYEKLENMRLALAEMAEELDSDDYDNLSQRDKE